MDTSELTLRQVEGDVIRCVVSDLQHVKQQLAELTDEVKLVKRCSVGSEMEQNVAESHSMTKLLAADFNTTRTILISELRNILHAIPSRDEKALQEQLITANEALKEAQKESLSELKALQEELSNTKRALQKAETEVSEGNNSQNELQRELQATKDEVMETKEETIRLTCDLARVKSESANQVRALQEDLSHMKESLQKAETTVLEVNSSHNELQKELQATKEEVLKEKEEVKILTDKLKMAKSESSDQMLLRSLLNDTKWKLQKAQKELLASNKSQEKLEKELRVTKEKVVKANEEVKELRAELEKAQRWRNSVKEMIKTFTTETAKKTEKVSPERKNDQTKPRREFQGAKRKSPNTSNK